MPSTISSLFRTWFRKLFFQYAYYKAPPWDTGVTPPELLDFITLHKPGRALDLGCGTGTNVITLAEHGWQVTGVDYISRAIRAAKHKIKDKGVVAEVRVDDVTNLKTVEGRFDLVYDIGCYHNLSPTGKRSYEQNLCKLLEPGGFYLLYGFLNQTGVKFGINKDDQTRLNFFMTQIKVIEGQDRGRSSAWFEFQYIR
jgi:SAM-dependent methyltransferase